MILDKALLVKGLVGATSVVGLGGVVVFRKELGIVKTSSQDNAVQDTGESGEDQGRDERGIPNKCNATKPCDLTAEDLKQIKFKELGDEGEVTVENFPAEPQKITLAIKGSNENKRYIFENSGTEQVTLKRGSAEVNLSFGKTRFVDENNKLKPMETGIYGLPSQCTSSQSCTLIDDDLGQIKFSGFTDGKESTVSGLSENQTITLTIEDDTYIFNNSEQSSVTIQNGSTNEELTNGETEFKREGDKLKKVIIGGFGLSVDCQLEGASESKNCTLNLRDLKKVKFKDIGNNPTITGLNNGEKITLVIQKIDDSSYPDRTKYTFTPGSSSDVVITGSPQSVTLLKEGGTTFKKDSENNVLVEIPKKQPISFKADELDNKISNLGLPTTCTFKDKASGDSKSIECELSLEELKKLKFDGKDSVTLTGGHGEGNEKNYKLKIEESEEDQFKDKKIRVTFLNKGNNSWDSKLTIKSGNEDNSPITIYNNSDTEFKINSQNKLEKAWGVSDLSGLVGLECNGAANNTPTPCSMKTTDGTGTIKVLFERESSIKDFKPTNSSLLNLTYDGYGGDKYSQGFKFSVSEVISGTVNGENKELTSDYYEIKRVGNGNWAFSITEN